MRKTATRRALRGLLRRKMGIRGPSSCILAAPVGRFASPVYDHCPPACASTYARLSSVATPSCVRPLPSNSHTVWVRRVFAYGPAAPCGVVVLGVVFCFVFWFCLCLFFF